MAYYFNILPHHTPTTTIASQKTLTTSLSVTTSSILAPAAAGFLTCYSYKQLTFENSSL